jgi:hypothetical protein
MPSPKIGKCISGITFIRYAQSKDWKTHFWNNLHQVCPVQRLESQMIKKSFEARKPKGLLT